MGNLFSRSAVISALSGVLLATACQTSAAPPPAPTPTPVAEKKCSADDHYIDEISLGWSFCYPSSWRYRERFQPSKDPQGVDATFDIVVNSGTPGPDQGAFGFMIVGSYDRGGIADLTAWAAKYLPDGTKLASISWGNAIAAATVTGGHERLAMTDHRIYVLDVHEGQGNLSLDTEMGKRLSSWKFAS